MKGTAARFGVKEVSADKGCLGHDKFKAIVETGAAPSIPCKSNTTGEGPELGPRLYRYFMFNRDDFLAHYHKRSNGEPAFSIIKGPFGDSVRSRMEPAQVNELLCKVLCHNLDVLVQAIYKLKVEPIFWPESA